MVANYARPLLEDPIADMINADGLSAALAWGLPFAATVIIWFLLASLLSPGLTRAGLGGLDRWLGVIFGLARGYLLVMRFIGAVLAIEGEKICQQPYKMPKHTLFNSAQYFAKFMPDDYSAQIIVKLIDHTGDNATAAKTIEKMIDDGAAIVKKPLELLNDEKSN